MKQKTVIYIELSELARKFILYHTNQSELGLVLDRKNSFAKFISTKIKIAPNGFNPLAHKHNTAIVLPNNYSLNGYDPRYVPLFIPEKKQKEINIFFRKFFIHQFCVQAYDSKKSLKVFINDIMEKYDLTEDDISIHALEVAFWRYKKDMHDPQRFLKNMLHVSSHFVI